MYLTEKETMYVITLTFHRITNNERRRKANYNFEICIYSLLWVKQYVLIDFIDKLLWF